MNKHVQILDWCNFYFRKKLQNLHWHEINDVESKQNEVESKSNEVESKQTDVESKSNEVESKQNDVESKQNYQRSDARKHLQNSYRATSSASVKLIVKSIFSTLLLSFQNIIGLF